MYKIFYIVVYVAISLYGLYKLKASGVGSFEWVVGFGAYGGGFLLWLYILRLYPLSIAFPLAAGSLILGTQLVGFIIMHEPADMYRIGGAALIFSGIVMLAISDIGKS